MEVNMRRLSLLLPIVAFLFCSTGSKDAGVQFAKTSFEEVLSQAQQSEKLVLVDFFSET